MANTSDCNARNDNSCAVTAARAHEAKLLAEAKDFIMYAWDGPLTPFVVLARAVEFGQKHPDVDHVVIASALNEALQELDLVKWTDADCV